MRKKKNISLYPAIESVLETGTDDEIALAKKQYWTRYKAQWRKEHRKKNKEYTVSFCPNERKIIERVAREHNRSCSRYIKLSSLAYAKQVFLIMDPTIVHQVRELLFMNYCSLQDILDERDMKINKKELLERIDDLEYKILNALEHPQLLPEALKEIIFKNPNLKIELITLLQSIHDDY